MIDFKEITIEDREWVQPLLDHSSYRGEEYSFTFMYLWRDVFEYRIAQVNDYFVLKSVREDHPVSYLLPAGKGDLAPVLAELDKDAASHGVPLIFHAMTKEGRELLETTAPDRFDYIELTDYFDYVYDSERMQTLSGKKLSSKRNHINRFKENFPDWSYERITSENLAEVITMSEKWISIEEKEDNTSSFEQEVSAVDEALHQYEELQLHGGLLRAGGEVVAFTMADRVTDDTLLIHIEKAYKEVQGAYPMINQQFALDVGKDYTYINREDDSGHPGLRRAKQSYQPVFMVEKYGAKCRCDDKGGRGNGEPCYQ